MKDREKGDFGPINGISMDRYSDLWHDTQNRLSPAAVDKLDLPEEIPEDKLPMYESLSNATP